MFWGQNLFMEHTMNSARLIDSIRWEIGKKKFFFDFLLFVKNDQLISIRWLSLSNRTALLYMKIFSNRAVSFKERYSLIERPPLENDPLIERSSLIEQLTYNNYDYNQATFTYKTILSNRGIFLDRVTPNWMSLPYRSALSNRRASWKSEKLQNIISKKHYV